MCGSGHTTRNTGSRCDCQEKSEPLARKILSHYRQKKSEPYWGERWKNIEPLSGEDIRL
jgi:hypothetical protein